MIPGIDRVGEKRSGWAHGDNLIIGNTARQITLQAKFDDASQFSVQFDVQLPPNFIAYTQAKIILSMSGVTINRMIDVASGVTLSGVAEAVRVIVSDVTPIAILSPGESISYPVSVTIGRFPRPFSSVTPVLTGFPKTTIAPAGSQQAEVPPGAIGFVIFGADDTDGGPPTLSFKQLTANQTGPGSTLLMFSEVLVGQNVPLMSGAQLVSITNNGANAADVTLLWLIDG